MDVDTRDLEKKLVSLREKNAPSDGKWFSALSLEWIKKWKDFTSNSNKPEPGSIDNSSLYSDSSPDFL